MSKATSVPQANHSRYSSPVELFNLIVESKTLPVEVNNSTIELHFPLTRMRSLQSYCSVDFDLLVLMRFDMTAPVSVNSQIHAIKMSHFHFYWYCLSMKVNFQKEYLWKYIY